MVDELDRLGYVERTPDPGDGAAAARDAHPARFDYLRASAEIFDELIGEWRAQGEDIDAAFTALGRLKELYGGGLRPSGSPSSAAALSRRTALATSVRQLEPVELGQAGLGVEHRVVGPEAELPAQPARDLALDLVGQVAVLPAGDVEVDVGLVQRHRDRLEVPRPADVGEHDLHVRVAGGDAVEQDRPREVDPQALAAGLAGAEPARARVGEQDQARARRPRRRTAGSGRRRGRSSCIVGWSFRPAQPQLGEAREPLQRVLAVRVDAAEARRSARSTRAQIRAISALSSSLPLASHPSSTPTRSSRS